MSFTVKGLPVLIIVVFLVLMLSPFGLNFAKPVDVPKPDKPKNEKECVESATWMRANHMQLLDEWRNDVVRDGKREYMTQHVKKDFMGPYDKSLTRTCLKCHDKKTKFCDRCHTYASVKPYCWTCHVVPKESE